MSDAPDDPRGLPAILVPWLVLAGIELHLATHGFTQHTWTQWAVEPLALAIVGVAQWRLGQGAWRSPLIPGVVAVAWTWMNLNPGLVGWLGALVIAVALIVRVERSVTVGLIPGVVMALLGGVGARWLILDKASGGGSSSVARSAITRLTHELTSLPPSAGAAGSKPPIVLITVDTLRWDDARDMEVVRRLGARGSVWERAMSTSSWTVPALASAITGHDTRGHGAGIATDGKLQAIGDVPTLAETLGDGGYTTAAVATNAWLAGGLGFDRGFDTYWHADADFHHRLLLMGWPQGPKAHEGEAVVDRALRVLQELPDDGWFLWVHLLDPHLPYFHSEAGAGLSDERLRTGMRHDAAKREQVRGAYRAEVAYTDTHLSRLLDALDARGVLDRGTVLFTADHGEEFWDHGATGHGHSHHAEVVDVPLVLVGCDAPAGPRRDLASLADVGRTLAAIGGTPIGSGRDLCQPLPERIVTSQGNAYFEQQASASDGITHAIRMSPDDADGTCFERSDAAELHARPCVRGELTSVLMRTRAPSDNGAGGGNVTASMLQELGYIEETD